MHASIFKFTQRKISCKLTFYKINSLVGLHFVFNDWPRAIHLWFVHLHKAWHFEDAHICEVSARCCELPKQVFNIVEDTCCVLSTSLTCERNSGYVWSRKRSGRPHHSLIWIWYVVLFDTSCMCEGDCCAKGNDKETARCGDHFHFVVRHENAHFYPPVPSSLMAWPPCSFTETELSACEVNQKLWHENVLNVVISTYSSCINITHNSIITCINIGGSPSTVVV